MKLNLGRTVSAGIAGTLVMTAVGVYAAPMMGMPAMNPATMLATKMGDSLILGWMGHLMIGIILAAIYAAVAQGKLPGPPVVQGAIFALAPWLMAGLLVMPMMGMPLFSGSMSLAVGSLVGHLMYGAVVGGVLGVRAPAAAT